MPTIGIRALKNSTAEVIRAVRENQAEYVVTHRGQPVAVILPVESSASEARVPSQELVEALAAMRARIASEWRNPEGALEVLAAQRR